MVIFNVSLLLIRRGVRAIGSVAVRIDANIRIQVCGHVDIMRGQNATVKGTWAAHPLFLIFLPSGLHRRSPRLEHNIL